MDTDAHGIVVGMVGFSMALLGFVLVRLFKNCGFQLSDFPLQSEPRSPGCS